MASESQNDAPEERNPMSLRMPAELRQRLQSAADREHRTLTGEILHRLEQSFSEAEEAA